MSFAVAEASSAAFFAALALVFLADAADGCLAFSANLGVREVGIAAKKNMDYGYLQWVAGALVCLVTDLPERGRSQKQNTWCRQPLHRQTKTVLT
jgi:hypothetical protein